MKWWERNKELLVREKKRLDAYCSGNDFSFEILEEHLWLKGNIYLDLESKYLFPFECKFPKSYPYAPPTIYPEDRKSRWVEGHQFVSDGRFCLDIRENNWKSSYSSVEIIESMRILVYASIDKYINKKEKLDVNEGIEPTRFELLTDEVRCLYASDLTPFNTSVGIFNYFEFKELGDNRIIITPELKGDDPILSFLKSEYFSIWDLNAFFTKKGVFLNLNQSLIESLSKCKKLEEFFTFLKDNSIIEKQEIEELFTKNKSEYILFTNENNKPVLLTQLDLKKDSLVYYGCYGIDFNKLQERIPNKIESNTLSTKKVTIIGCGSGGSVIAEFLVKSGITKLVLIDFEILETENIFRHNCTLRDIGLKKTYALKQRLRKINPKVSISILDKKIESITEVIDEQIKDSDLIINAIGNSENLINSYSYLKNIPTIHCKVYPWGFGGEVIRVIPDIHPCFECMDLQLSKILDDAPKVSEFPFNKTIDYNTAINGDNIPIPSLAVDAGFIINIASKMAIETVLLSTEELKEKACVILWGNKREWIFKEDFSCLKLFSENLKPLKKCIVCSNTEVILEELSMDIEEVNKAYSSLIKKTV